MTPRPAAGGFAFGPAPRDEPLAYPGAVPPHSFLFTGAAIEPIDDHDEHALVEVIGGPARPLATRLHDLRATPMVGRRAVLAYASNASPAQLRAKFAAAGVDPVVPVLRARVAGLAVVYAAYVTRYGSVPATVVADATAVTDTWVTYLDDDQLALVDRTEGNHDRPTLSSARFALHLLTGTVVPWYACYRARPGVLCLYGPDGDGAEGHGEGGAPVCLREIASVGSTLPARTQTEMHELLLPRWNHHGGGHADVAAFIARVRAEPAYRDEVNRWLIAAVGEREPDLEVGVRAVAPW